MPVAWILRALVGLLLGEYWRLERPVAVGEGAAVDWWVVSLRSRGQLVLRAVRWHPGEAWLGYQIDNSELVQVGSLRPRGLPGLLYWKMLQPIHRFIFIALTRRHAARIAGDTPLPLKIEA